MAVEPTVFSEPSPEDADSLVSSNDPDDMQNEQTWPTEEEMQDNDSSRKPIENSQLPEAGPGTTPLAVRRVPKGISEYQAAWIVDGDDDGDEDKLDSEEDAQNGSAEELVEVPVHLECEMEPDAKDGNDDGFQDLEEAEESKQSVYLFLRGSFLTQCKG
jgi:pre-rRNA-processing protein TSR1